MRGELKRCMNMLGCDHPVSSISSLSPPPFLSLSSISIMIFIYPISFILSYHHTIITSSFSLLNSFILFFVTLSFFVNTPSFFYLVLPRSILSFLPLFLFFPFSFPFLSLYFHFTFLWLHRQFEDSNLPVHPIIQSFKYAFIDSFSQPYRTS